MADASQEGAKENPRAKLIIIRRPGRGLPKGKESMVSVIGPGVVNTVAPAEAKDVKDLKKGCGNGSTLEVRCDDDVVMHEIRQDSQQALRGQGGAASAHVQGQAVGGNKRVVEPTCAP